MLFNSITFLIFLPIVFIIYWNLKSRSSQNAFLLIASYVFYGWWDWRFLGLIAFSSLVDFFIGQSLAKAKKENKRKILLFTSVFINIGLLGFFKYFNFFLTNFVNALSLLGIQGNYSSLQIILPVGISFYTFQTLSYSLDIYHKKLKPTNDIIAFLAFVSFFPQLVAGPIERAVNLLPQLKLKRNFNYENAVSGVKLIIWGFFKKLILADNCADAVNQIFSNYRDMDSLTLILGTVFFAFQIYGDFSGYSDIAIGLAKLFNINLMRNFAYPYFSRNIAEFWRRWHISLTTWFIDYVYIPLGGSRGNNWLKIRNVFVIFLISGFWHGANWTFIFWGFLNALYFLPLLLVKRNRKYLSIVAENKKLPTLLEAFQMFITFLLVCFAWIFFRSASLSDAFHYIELLFSFNGGNNFVKFFYLIPYIFLVLLIEWSGRRKECPIAFNFKYKAIKYSFYILMIILIMSLGAHLNKSFIYFQF